MSTAHSRRKRGGGRTLSKAKGEDGPLEPLGAGGQTGATKKNGKKIRHNGRENVFLGERGDSGGAGRKLEGGGVGD